MIFVIYYMKLEVTWILTNLCYGPTEISVILLTEGLCPVTGNLKLSIPVVEFIKNCLLSDDMILND